MAKQLFNNSSGQKDPSALTEDFRFEFPIVSLSKEVSHALHLQNHLACSEIGLNLGI